MLNKKNISYRYFKKFNGEIWIMEKEDLLKQIFCWEKK